MNIVKWYKNRSFQFKLVIGYLVLALIPMLCVTWYSYGKTRNVLLTEAYQSAEQEAERITGKKAMIGNNVSHSKRRTKRTFDLNLFNKKFYYVEQDCWISLSICANGLRIINKKGLDAALKDAVAKGYCDWKSIKVIG